MSFNLKDVQDWAIANGESTDIQTALRNIPARLGMLDADVGCLSADVQTFDRDISGRGYALVIRSKDIDAVGRRQDSRVRALLKRFHAANLGFDLRNLAVRKRYDALMNIIEANEGKPGSGMRWNIGHHRSLTILRARAILPPEGLVQEEIDRIGREISSQKRKGLRKTIKFLNSLFGLTNEIPKLREFLPMAPLSPPAGSSWAKKMDWSELPEPFRASFDAAADACLAGKHDLAEQSLARIEAGEDPETVMAEADELSQSVKTGVNKPTAAREEYRYAISWLVRSYEEVGGDLDALTDIRDLFTRATIEAAIKDQIHRSKAAPDLKDPIVSTTLKTRLTSLKTIAKRGLDDMKAVAILKFLQAQHYDVPRKKLVGKGDSSAITIEVDRIAENLRQRPELANVWTNAPRTIADSARKDIEAARLEKSVSREITALRKFAGAVAYAIQMSRPMRTECLRFSRIASDGEAHANLVRMSPDQTALAFRFAPREIKNIRWVTVDIVGHDAEILMEWINTWRPRFIELKALDAQSIYLFPGSAKPKYEEGDPVSLPRGCLAGSTFLELWRDASEILGIHETPHHMRHIVALLILAFRPGDYAFVSTVLGNTAAVAEDHYGRDDGQAASREARSAMLAAHSDLFHLHNARYSRERCDRT